MIEAVVCESLDVSLGSSNVDYFGTSILDILGSSVGAFLGSSFGTSLGDSLDLSSGSSICLPASLRSRMPLKDCGCYGPYFYLFELADTHPISNNLK